MPNELEISESITKIVRNTPAQLLKLLYQHIYYSQIYHLCSAFCTQPPYIEPTCTYRSSVTEPLKIDAKYQMKKKVVAEGQNFYFLRCTLPDLIPNFRGCVQKAEQR